MANQRAHAIQLELGSSRTRGCVPVAQLLQKWFLTKYRVLRSAAIFLSWGHVKFLKCFQTWERWRILFSIKLLFSNYNTTLSFFILNFMSKHLLVELTGEEKGGDFVPRTPCVGVAPSSGARVNQTKLIIFNLPLMWFFCWKAAENTTFNSFLCLKAAVRTAPQAVLPIFSKR